jgi:probable HAF family extracellular repeat protein
MTQLSTLGGKLAGASDINNNGQIAGASEARGGAWHACLWQDGNVTDVHPAGVLSQANCINNAGDTAGYYRLDNFTCNAFIRQNGVTADLGSTGAEFTYTLANGINDNAQVVGCSATEDNSRMHAFLWQNGVMTDLGNLGMEHCWANSINNKGQIVGASYSIPGEMEHGCIWEDGVIIDLNDLVDPEGGWKIQYAQCINDIGQIVGVGYNDSSSGAVLLTPISEADRVKIDIKPGDPANSINLRSRGVVPVAVISTSEFDALAIDYASVVFAGAKPAKWGKVDVNSDGRVDMLFHFRTQELKLSVKCAEAKLTGKTTDGKLIDGIDSVKILK